MISQTHHLSNKAKAQGLPFTSTINYLRKTILMILLCGVCTLAFSQKVALVLSGGGAKGAAHLGVIKALEENNIPIDYIVGTSMGGVVGAFYASGYSPEEMESLILSDDFQRWMSGDLSEDIYFFSKKEDSPSLLSVRLKFDSSFNASFNSNLASDLLLNFALTKLFAKASQRANYNFDSLMVPYRSLGAEIFTQKEVILSKGNVNDAARATMTVPLFYRPIKVENQYLFDGGVYNNFPVDVAIQEFNPDIIIGVNVSSKVFDTYPFEQDKNLMNNMVMYLLLDKSNPDAVGDKGVYIQPNLNTYTAYDFRKVGAMIDSGYMETYRHIEQIKSAISRRVDSVSLLQKRKDFIMGQQPLQFSKIRLYGFKTNQREYVRQVFGKNKKSNPLISEIEEGYHRLISDEYFQNIYPGMEYDPKEKAYHFQLFAEPEPILTVDIGGNVSSRNISQIYLGATYSHFNYLLFKHTLNAYNGRFYRSVQWKSKLTFPYSLPFYLEPEFTYNNWDYLSASDIISEQFNAIPPTILRQVDRKFVLNTGVALGKKARLVISAGGFNNKDNFSNNATLVSSDTLDVFRLSGQVYSLNFTRSKLNYKQYASKGYHLDISLSYVDGKERYESGNTSALNAMDKYRSWVKLKISAERYFDNRGAYTPGYLLSAVLSNQPVFINYNATINSASAFSPLPDSPTLLLQNFRSNNYLGAGFRNVISINQRVDFRAEFYAFKPLWSVYQTVAQTPDQEFKWEDIHFAASSSVVYHSPLGPISLSANYYDDQETPFAVLLNIGYLLFNKRSLD